MLVTTINRLWIFGWTVTEYHVLYKHWWYFNFFGLIGNYWTNLPAILPFAS